MGLSSHQSGQGSASYAHGAAWLLVLLGVMACPSTALAQDEAAAPVLGRMLADFELADPRGRTYRLADLADKPVVVVAFLGIECPLAKIYSRRLSELATRYAAQGVAVLGVDSNQQDALEELAQFAVDSQLTYPLVKDAGNRLADQLGVRRTPEVCVLDAQRRVVYHGRIDDQFEIGIQRPRPSRDDLSRALDDLLAGRPIERAATPVSGCLIGRLREPSAEAAVTWNGQIAALVAAHCQECHRPGQVGPFSLMSYDDAVGWAEMIGEVVVAGRMPPWHASAEHGEFANCARLSDAERDLVAHWVEKGAPRGDSIDPPPPPRAFHETWRIAEPEAVVYMSEEPYEVPLTGPVTYQWFTADPGFTEDRWVRAAEARPGPDAREVVHHVTVYIKPPGVPFDLRMNDRINLLVGYNPGGDPWQAPEEMAMRIPAGSELVFEMHYTPDGLPHADCSCVGLTFADPSTVRQEIHSIMPANDRFEIPPGAPRHPVKTAYLVPNDSLLLLMRPHMHLRGRDFRYTAYYPDRTSEVLLDIPRWDFNWQNNYVLAAPKRLPAGTRIVCEAHFDNSAGNPANPDPAATVHWGDQTSDEMMIGILALAWADEDRLAAKPAPSAPLPSVAGPVAVVGLVAVGGVVGLIGWRRRVVGAANADRR